MALLYNSHSGGSNMSKICKNCGEEMDDSAVFCVKCGTKTEDTACEVCSIKAADGAAKTGVVGKINGFINQIKSKDKKAIGVAAGAVAVLILILVLVFALGSSGPEKAVDNYFDVMFNGKASKIEDLAPKAYWDYAADDKDVKVRDVKKIYEDYIDKIIDELEDEYGDDIKIRVKVVETDEVSKKTLDTMKDNLKKRYNIPKKDVSKALELECEVTIKGDDDKDTDEIKLYAVKIKGDWYPCTSSDGSLAVDALVALAALANLG